MARTVILSEDTVSSLLEAHASLAAWYYELVRALQSQSPARAPDEAARLAFLARLAADFPEIAATAQKITAPRMYVPPPPAFAVPAVVAPAAEPPPISLSVPSPVSIAAAPSVPVPVPVPVPAPVPVPEPSPFSSAPATTQDPSPPSAAVAPPPLVLPGSVKY